MWYAILSYNSLTKLCKGRNEVQISQLSTRLLLLAYAKIQL